MDIEINNLYRVTNRIYTRKNIYNSILRLLIMNRIIIYPSALCRWVRGHVRCCLSQRKKVTLYLWFITKGIHKIIVPIVVDDNNDKFEMI